MHSDKNLEAVLQPDKSFRTRYNRENEAELDMKEFVVGFDFKMILSAESQVAKKKQAIPDIPKKAKWQAKKSNRYDGHRWFLCSETTDGTKQPCKTQEVTYST